MNQNKIEIQSFRENNPPLEINNFEKSTTVHNTKIKKDKLNSIQTRNQQLPCSFDDQLHNFQVYAQNDLDMKCKPSFGNNPQESSKCTPDSSVIFNFKLHIPPRLIISNTSLQQRNYLYQSEQKEIHKKQKKKSCSNTASFQSRTWKEMENYKDNIVSHLVTALAALEGKYDSATTLQQDHQQKRIAALEKNLSQNLKETETENRVAENEAVNCEEVPSKRQNSCKFLNITPHCKGCYSICSPTTSQQNYMHVEAKPLGDNFGKELCQDLKNNEYLPCDNSYKNKNNTIKDSILSENIAHLSKHYALHSQYWTSSEKGEYVSSSKQNKMRSIHTISTPGSTSVPSTWTSSTRESFSASSAESKWSSKNGSKNTDSSFDRKNSPCSENVNSSQNGLSELEKKKDLNNCVINSGKAAKKFSGKLCPSLNESANSRNLINNTLASTDSALKKIQNTKNTEKSNYSEAYAEKEKETRGSERIFKHARRSRERNNFTPEDRKGFRKERLQRSTEENGINNNEEEIIAARNVKFQTNARILSLDKIDAEILNLKKELKDISSHPPKSENSQSPSKEMKTSHLTSY